VVFCLALIALLNFGAFAAQNSSLQIPKKTIGFEKTSTEDFVAINPGNSAGTITTVEDIKKRFGRTLIIVDTLLLAMAVIFSYVLSGLTLRPVRKVIEQQEEFAQEVSHELRTPLSVMTLEIESLKRASGKTPLVISAADNISGELNRMNRLVDGLLILVHPKKDRKDELIQPFVLADAAKNIFTQLDKMAKTKHLKYTFTSDFAGKVVADRQDIEQCISILLENAIKYSPVSSSISVTVHAHSKHEAIVTILDTGQGISEEDLPHIYDRFYRGNKGDAKSQGMGLGLAVAKKIIAIHKGRIAIESRLGEGTTAQLFIPIYQLK
jgi:signal transduction histidine kinase